MSDLQTIQESWDRAAVEDAMFNILTHADRRNGGWTAEEFFATGKSEIDELIGRLDGLGLRSECEDALDFGCGVGRLTQALPFWYKRAIGADISPEMIRQARELNRHRGSCQYVQTGAHLLAWFAAASFDLIYSQITLQHMPPDLQRGYVEQFIQLLAPEGVAVFAIPEGPDVGHPGWHLSMYGTPQATVEEWVAAAGGVLIDVEDLGQDGEWRQIRYTAVAS